MQHPKISVVIPTHNRSDSIIRLLTKLERSDFPLAEMECIVVCDGCTDDTVLKLQQFSADYIFKFIETPGSGAAYARHHGAMIASGDLLIFLDDDIDPAPQLLSSFHSLVQTKKDVGIGFLILEEIPDKSWNRLYLNHWWETHFEQLSKPDHKFTYKDLTSGAFSLFRSFYVESDGFDTRFRCREDYEFGHRLLKSGARFRFSKLAMGIHCDNVSDQNRLHRRKQSEGYWDVEIVRKHPELWDKTFLCVIHTTTSWRRWFIWGAFYVPHFGRMFFKGLYRSQLWMEQNKFRHSWLSAEGKQHRFHYTLGVAAQFATPNQFNKWASSLVSPISLEDRGDQYDQLYFANRWLSQHKINGQVPKLLSEPLRRFLSFEYFKEITQNVKYPTYPLPYISIIVCTRDRTTFLKDCLQALFELEYPAKEIIIVDNAPSSDATKRLCAGLPVKYVLETKAGLDNARNTGIEHSTHDIIAFTDDDARPDKNWLKRMVPHFQEAEVMCVTGYVAPWSLETKAERLFEFNYGGMGHGFERKQFDGSTMTAFDKLKAAGMGVGANMAFRKKWFLTGGLFDPKLDVGTPSGGGGDVEMFHRVVAKGYKLIYDPSVMVWHIHRADLKGLKKQVFMNGKSFFYYLATVFRNNTVPRPVVIRFMVFDWIWGWIFKNMLFNKYQISRKLLLQELNGLLQASIKHQAWRG